ncbi:histidine kinase [Coriobacterium glomerans PW2]|uniref:Sensor-like histidine kinase SenX3 n=1 Tax=Coriobacterium glomerans (strain ATCC 49209 / DSM 20642 / JCM 10262 / PW2) TaxID=700015 RepID=F2N741_CORGP|nr:HAMP domain-containing sensor histidine kinase [Coriobacterium glomerans]AEB06380.1 histidine kinase [Coriobacterium glomerans PW2]
MDSATLIALSLIIGLGLGMVLGTSVYAVELRRMARFLRDRERRSGARLTLKTFGPGLRELAVAVNTELDQGLEERVLALRRRQEFQRDLSALSHDIRTPLTGAKGYLQLATGERQERMRTRYLEAANARIDSTIRLLDQLFAYTRASDPDLVLSRETVDVAPIIEAVLLAHFPEFEERKWEPTVHMEARGVTVVGDRDALCRIAENLVTNAIRYGVSAPLIEARDGRLVFSNRIADPSALDVERLFDRFYQADSSRGAAGAGLGLSTAHKLAQAMEMDLTASVEDDMLMIELVFDSPRSPDAVG